MIVNFWSFLIGALVNFIQYAIIAPLFGGPENFHTAIGLGGLIGANATVVLDLAFAAIGNFNLTIPGIGLALSLLIWVIKLAVNTYLAIKRLIPFIG